MQGGVHTSGRRVRVGRARWEEQDCEGLLAPLGAAMPQNREPSSSSLLSSLEFSDTTIYEPYIRALLGTVPHFCTVCDGRCLLSSCEALLLGNTTTPTVCDRER